jgi:hypothetical protein
MRLQNLREWSEDNIVQDLTKQFTTAESETATLTLGQIMLYTGTNIPDGWLPCDRRMLRRKTYPELYRLIGIKYGDGDGSNTAFNLPKIVAPNPDSQYIIFVDMPNT